MDIEKLKFKFPSGFPVELLPEGAKEQRIEVYRICRTGKIEPASFLPTYLDELAKTKENENDIENIGYYSMSTYEKEGDTRRKLKFFRGFQPNAIAAKGVTDPSCGPSQRSKERTRQKDSHVDWWLYEGVEPHIFFSQVNFNPPKEGGGA